MNGKLAEHQAVARFTRFPSMRTGFQTVSSIHRIRATRVMYSAEHISRARYSFFVQSARGNKLQNMRENYGFSEWSVKDTLPEIRPRRVARRKSLISLGVDFVNPLHFNTARGTVIKLPASARRQARF